MPAPAGVADDSDSAVFPPLGEETLIDRLYVTAYLSSLNEGSFAVAEHGFFS